MNRVILIHTGNLVGMDESSLLVDLLTLLQGLELRSDLARIVLKRKSITGQWRFEHPAKVYGDNAVHSGSRFVVD